MDEDGAAPAVVAAAAADEAKRMDEAVASRVALLRRADEHGIKVPDDAKTDAQIATAIAVALGADATRCDSLDYARAWIDAAPARRADSWGDELRTDSRRSGAPTFSF
jgi:hypothetical protein